jgi:hypothetical protein
MSSPENPHVFPQDQVTVAPGHIGPNVRRAGGVTLRDAVAIAVLPTALQVQLENAGAKDVGRVYAEVAIDAAFVIADLFLARRER